MYKDRWPLLKPVENPSLPKQDDRVLPPRSQNLLHVAQNIGSSKKVGFSVNGIAGNIGVDVGFYFIFHHFVLRRVGVRAELLQIL